MNEPRLDNSSIQTFLAFDYGLKRVGVAVGNTLTASAQALKTIDATGAERWQKIEQFITEWQPDALVIGVPFHPDGAEHENTLRARKFGRQLNGRFHLQVFEVDERYSTVDAYRLGAKESNVDAVSATVILERFFQSLQV